MRNEQEQKGSIYQTRVNLQEKLLSLFSSDTVKRTSFILLYKYARALDDYVDERQRPANDAFDLLEKQRALVALIGSEESVVADDDSFSEILIEALSPLPSNIKQPLSRQVDKIIVNLIMDNTAMSQNLHLSEQELAQRNLYALIPTLNCLSLFLCNDVLFSDTQFEQMEHHVLSTDTSQYDPLIKLLLSYVDISNNLRDCKFDLSNNLCLFSREELEEAGFYRDESLVQSPSPLPIFERKYKKQFASMLANSLYALNMSEKYFINLLFFLEVQYVAARSLYSTLLSMGKINNEVSDLLTRNTKI